MGRVFLLSLLLPVSLTAQITTDRFDFLDFKSDAAIEETKDYSAPQGYGPEVLHLHADHLLALAKGAHLENGTVVALYRELSPQDEDADGIIVFGAQYGDDIAEAHNTKALLPHFWFEQDDDSGVHFVQVTEAGTEKVFADIPGRGLVGNPWNVTGWIWQKVQIVEGHLRAKYWPAQKEEPEEWVIDTEFDGAVSGRIGFRIGSGDIELAHFSWSEEDISVAPPAAWLFPEQPNLALTGESTFRLFLHREFPVAKDYTLLVTANGNELVRGALDLGLEQGPIDVSILLTRTEGVKGVKHTVRVPSVTPGTWTLALLNEAGETVAGTTIEVKNEVSLQQRLVFATDALEFLTNTLAGQQKDLDPRTIPADEIRLLPLLVIQDAAAAHIDEAQGQVRAGKIRAADISLRYAEEALAELHGFKGDYFSPAVKNPAYRERFPQMPEPYIGAEELKHEYAYPPNSSFVLPVLDPYQSSSAIMGGSWYSGVSNLQHGQDAIAGRYTLRLTDLIEKRTVATSEGARASMQIEMQIVPEMREVLQPTPSVLDEYHSLLFTASDPATGAAYLLYEDPPAAQISSKSAPYSAPGQAYTLGEVYVASASLQIQLLTEGPAAIGEANKLHVRVTRHDKTPLDASLLVAMAAENQETLHEEVRPLHFDGGDETLNSDFSWPVNVSGRRDYGVKVVCDGQVLTEVRHSTRTPGVGSPAISPQKKILERKDGQLATALVVRFFDKPTGPVHAQVFAEGRLVGETTASDTTFTIEAEPWFGYYDVILDFGEFRHIERIIATVVETRDGQLLVNGEPFIIKGLNVHGMDASSPERTRNMMRIFKDLGFNMLRGDYPPRWEVDMAYEENLAWTVLAPYSCTNTDEIFARFDGPPMAAAREQTRIFIDRYVDSAGVLLWNSANEIEGDLTNFIRSLYPVYKHFDPYKRPVHYANLFAQNRWQGQDAMSINYYFNEGETPEARHPMILRDIKVAKEHGLPVFYTEFNSWYGAVHSSGVTAMEGLYDWGIENGMCGGFFYFRFNSDRHPGVIDDGFNTHKLLNDALRKSFADAEVALVERATDHLKLEVRNRRPFALRKLHFEATANGVAIPIQTVPDLGPGESALVSVPLPGDLVGPGVVLTGNVYLETHHGFRGRVPLLVAAE